MQSWMIGSATAVLTVGWMPQLPGPLGAFSLLLACLVTLAFRRWTIGCLLLGLACGLSWGELWGRQLLQQRLPAELETRVLEVEGVVLEPPQIRQYSSGGSRQRFAFQLERSSCHDKSHACPGFKGKVLLSYYGEQQLLVGERWQLQLRLKRPWGLANPGSFNYQSWLARHKFVATGYVRKEGAVVLSRERNARNLHQHSRQRINNSLRTAFAGREALGVLMALSSGDRSAITPLQWERFQHFGLNHLVVISGLHVGMVAGIGFLLGGLLGRFTVLFASSLDAHRMAHAAAFLVALTYSALAGFALPTVRALVMLAAVQLAGLGQRQVSSWRTLLLALWVIALIDPLASHSAGFWLSFVAVGLIFLVHQWHPAVRGLRQIVLLQLVLSGTLGVLGSFWFGGGSFAAPVANLLAIPVLSFYLAPLCLLAGFLSNFSEPLAIGLWQAALWPIEAFFAFAIHLEKAGLESWYEHHTSLGALCWAGLALLLLLAPRGLPMRRFAPVLLLPFLYPPAQTLPPGDYEVTVFDVGQGLAVAVRGEGLTLLYDTGSGDPAGPNMASSVIEPWLRGKDIHELDLLIVSHGDRDHASGVALLHDSPGVKELWYGDESFELESRQLPCQRGQQRQLGDIAIRQLHPGGTVRESRSNNRSCVLMLDFGGLRLLLPGDIESAVERELVRQWGDELRADVLLVPHHGSGTSSSAVFLRRVQPRLAIVSAGYRSRFGHPKEDVLRRYRVVGAQVLETARSGAIELRISGGELVAVRAWREQRRFYWH